MGFPTITIDSSLILLRWLPQLVTFYLIKRNSSGLQSSSVPLHLEVAVNLSTCADLLDYSKPFSIDLAADASDIYVGAELSHNRQPVASYM